MLPDAKWQTITPQVAEDILSLNENVRKVSRTTVIRYAHLMSTGRWDYANGETIKFNGDGSLIDGQHRLKAIIESGVEGPFLLVYNCHSSSERDVSTTIDAGRMRTPAQIFAGRGLKHSRLRQTVLRTLGVWARHGGIDVSPYQYHIDTAGVVALDEVELPWDDISRFYYATHTFLPRPSISAAAIGRLRFDIERVDEILDAFAEPSRFPTDHPTASFRISMLRQKLKGQRGGFSAGDIWMVTLKLLDDVDRGRRLSVLRLPKRPLEKLRGETSDLKEEILAIIGPSQKKLVS